MISSTVPSSLRTNDRLVSEEGCLYEGRLWHAISLPGGSSLYVNYEPGHVSQAEWLLLKMVLRSHMDRALAGGIPIWEELLHDALQGPIEPFGGPIRIDDEWEDVSVPFSWPAFLIGLRGIGGETHELAAEARATFESLAETVDMRPVVVADPQIVLAIFPPAGDRESGLAEGIASALIDGLMSESFVETRAIWSDPIRSFPELVRTARRMVHILQTAEHFLDECRVLSVRGLGVYELLFAVRPQLRQAFADHVLPAGALAALGAELEQTVTVFVACDLNVSETARQLYLHRNSLLYRIERIRELTGYDIRHFADAVTVWSALLFKRL